MLLTLAGLVSTAYGFLPGQLQNHRWIKVLAIAAGAIALLFGSLEIFQRYQQQGFAYVTHDGEILKSRNFNGRIGAPTAQADGTVFLIESESYFGDASRVAVIPTRKVQTDVYNAVGGIGIRFHCPENSVPDFKVQISR